MGGERKGRRGRKEEGNLQRPGKSARRNQRREDLRKRQRKRGREGAQGAGGRVSERRSVIPPPRGCSPGKSRGWHLSQLGPPARRPRRPPQYMSL